MSVPFENIEKNISRLKSRESISADDIMDSMNRLYDDADAFNGSSGFPVRNIEDYSLALQDLVLVLKNSFDENRDRLDELEDEDVEEARKSVKEMSGALSVKETILRSLREERKTKDALLERFKKAEEEHTELTSALDRLKDIDPAALDEENRKLSAELKGKEEIEEKIKKTEAVLLSLREDLEALKKTAQDNESERGKIAEEIEKMKESISDHEAWKKNAAEERGKIASAAAQARDDYMLVQNSWQSLLLRDRISDVIEKTGAEELRRADMQSFADLSEWFEKAGKDIEAAIDAYTQMYRTVLGILDRA